MNWWGSCQTLSGQRRSGDNGVASGNAHRTRVFVQVSDPIGAGLVPSLGRPGGNVTGFTNFEYVTVGKWLEVLKRLRQMLHVC